MTTHVLTCPLSSDLMWIAVSGAALTPADLTAMPPSLEDEANTDDDSMATHRKAVEGAKGKQTKATMLVEPFTEDILGQIPLDKGYVQHIRIVGRPEKEIPALNTAQGYFSKAFHIFAALLSMASHVKVQIGVCTLKGVKSKLSLPPIPNWWMPEMGAPTSFSKLLLADLSIKDDADDSCTKTKLVSSIEILAISAPLLDAVTSHQSTSLCRESKVNCSDYKEQRQPARGRHLS